MFGTCNMRFKNWRAIYLQVLFLFLLLQSRTEARNYVILSMTKDGLRELRIAYRGRLFMETSLPNGDAPGNLVFCRASDGIRVVDTVIRQGLVNDCATTSSYSDVLSFMSEFSRVRPRSMLHSEDDVMDVYLGIKNFTAMTSLHPKNTAHIGHANISSVTNSHFKSGGMEQQQFSYRKPVLSPDYKNMKLSARIVSGRQSPFMKQFKTHFRIRKKSRQCRQFYDDAVRSVEMLTLLAEQVEDEEHSPLAALLNVSKIDNQMHNRNSQHHHHHHHHHGRHHPQHKRRKSDIEDEKGTLSGRGVQKEDFMPGSEPQPSSYKNTKSGVQKESPSLSKTVRKTKNKAFSSPAASSFSSQSPSNEEELAQNRTLVQPHSPESDMSPHMTGRASNVRGNGRYSNSSAASMGGRLGLPTHPDLPHSRSRRDLLTGWVIFPGTKWCGDGDIAEHKKDLGYHSELDKCCRRHDLCPLVIPKLSWKYGTFNYRLHTVSHCRCDRKFRKCLQASSSPLAHLIGTIYFNVVGPQCFKFTHKKACIQRLWWGGCRQYDTAKVAYMKRQRRFK